MTTMTKQPGPASFASRFKAVLLGISGQPTGMDALEPRCMLAGTPLPTLADLENPNNSVVRLETNYGDIDIELFNSQAPITVANYLNYVTSGRLDETFFHRSDIDFVLQGGGFGFTDDTGFFEVSSDAPIIREITGRSNVARTVAMARAGINTATSQFFVNYVDNLTLNPTGPDNGFAVFGRIIQGWDVVMSIQGLRPENITAVPPIFEQDEQLAINFLTTPVANSYVIGQPVLPSDLVQLINAEVIKPASVNGFYAQQLIMPEGFRSDNTVENLEVFNPNAAAATYQVIVHYENGVRDSVIASGTIASGAKLRIRLSDSGDATLNAVRANTPYAIVIQTALPDGTANPQPISGSVNRVDYNADTSEGMFNTAGYADEDLQTWDFGLIERNALSSEYLSWVSMTDEAGRVTVTLIGETSTTNFVFDLDAYRRGGMAFDDYTSIAAGFYSVRLTSTVPIVAFASDWDIPASGQPFATSYTPGFGIMGLPGGGSPVGGIADAVLQAGFVSTISLSNPGSTVAVVTMSLWRNNRAEGEDPITRIRILTAQSRFDYTLTDELGIPAGESFTVTYSAGSAQIAAQYTSVDQVGRNQSGDKRADGVATMLVNRIPPVTYFGDGEVDPDRTNGTQSERISIFNPFSDTAIALNYTVRYHFADGTSIDAFTGSLGARQRVALTTQSAPAVLEKAGSGTQFRNYAISVLAVPTTPGTGISLPSQLSGLVQLTRTDTQTGRSVTSTGAASGAGFDLDDPIFGIGG